MYIYMQNQTIQADWSHSITAVCIYEVFTLLHTGTIATYVRAYIFIHIPNPYMYVKMHNYIYIYIYIHIVCIGRKR